MKLNLIFSILILVLAAPQLSNARGSAIAIGIESTILGGAINSVDWTPYRINFEFWEAYPVLHPEPLNGRISLDASSLPLNKEISIIVELNLTVIEEHDDSIITIRLQFVLLNSTLIEGDHTYSFDEIDHLSGVSTVQGDGSVVPKTSYLYAEELAPGTNITSTIAIFFEQSDHTTDWGVQFSIEGEMFYNGDIEFYLPLPIDPLNLSTRSDIPFYFNILLLMPLAIIAGRMKNGIKF
ncbi:MAG: hypothetical protein GPJ54_18235 [Candidatus Heimdallarchaeota archaeon]|nr:hypothetical protein [Candidatus Heimdallarchaeota archaeon]